MTKTIHYCDCCGSTMDAEIVSRGYRLTMKRSIFADEQWKRQTQTDMELCGLCWNKMLSATAKIRQEAAERAKNEEAANG